MKKQRIYISGPISGHDYEERKNEFKRVQIMLEAQGYEVFNPMENGLPPDSTTARHMRRDLNELTREDDPYYAIYMMRKWNHSAGCWTEFHTALAIDLIVIFEQVGTFIRFE